MNRAFHIGGLVGFAAIFAAVKLGWNPALCAGLGALLFAAFLVKGGLPLWANAAAAAFCACMLSLAIYDAAVTEPSARLAGPRRVRAVVTDRADYGSYARFSLRCDGEGSPEGLADARIRVSAPAALDVAPGDVVEWDLELRIPAGERERERERLYSTGYLFEGNMLGAPGKVGERPRDPEAALARYRAGFRRNILRELPNGTGELLAAIITGRDEGISPSLRSDYSRAGLAHLLAVSGLHLSIVAALFDCLLSALRLSRRQRGAAGIAAVLAFMAFAGFSHSVVRAGIMLIICRAALLFGRDSDPLNSLGFAVLLMLLWNPYAAFSVGLQLSCLATMGIAAFSDPLAGWLSRRMCGRGGFELREARPAVYALLSAFSVTLCAQLFTAPALCWYFGQVSLVAPVVNLLVAPAVPAALGAGALCGLFGFFPALALPARACGLVGGVAAKAISDTAAWWARLPFVSLPVRSGWAVLWMAAVLLCGALLYARRASRALVRYAAALSVIVLLAGALSETALWGRTLEIALPENGSAAAVACGRQGALLGAPGSVYEARSLAAFFRDHGVRSIEVFAAREEGELKGGPAAVLTEEFPVGTAFGLDETHGFSAELFGCATLGAEGEDAEALHFTAGGLRIVKEFTQRPEAADLLINARNEPVAAPGVRLCMEDRYFGSTVVTLRAG